MLLVVDSSEDTRSSGFRQEKDFLSLLIRNLTNGDNKFALITFGKSINFQFNFDTYGTADELLSNLPYIWYSNGKGDPGQALDYAITHGLNSSHGDRAAVPDVIVFLMHGAVANSALATELREKLNKNSVELFVITIGGSQDGGAIGRIASHPSFLVHASNFAELQTLPQNISDAICKGNCF